LKNMDILTVGYAYIKKGYLDTFNHYPEKDRISFLLPKIWKAKGGKLKFYPPKERNILRTNFFFHHSHYPLIGGLLKGWAPLFPLFLLKRKYQLVYSCSEPSLLSTLYQGLWAKLFGLKHIIFTWENIPYENKFKGVNLLLKKIIIKLNLLLSDGVVCGNQKAKVIFSKITSKPIAVIPLSGVDTDFFRREDGFKEIENYNLTGKIVFNFSGAIGYRKGLQVILRAFKKVLAEIPNAHLVIMGSGEYEDKVRELVRELGLNENLTLTSWQDREGLKRGLNASDVFLYPSLSYGGWEEQFGYSMAEASLMELPVISTRSGSIGEVVLDGETGLLVEPDDIDGLKEAMVRLGKDSELRKKMGQAGRKYIIENYSYQIIANKFYIFFKSL